MRYQGYSEKTIGSFLRQWTETEKRINAHHIFVVFPTTQLYFPIDACSDKQWNGLHVRSIIMNEYVYLPFHFFLQEIKKPPMIWPDQFLYIIFYL